MRVTEKQEKHQKHAYLSKTSTLTFPYEVISIDSIYAVICLIGSDNTLLKFKPGTLEQSSIYRQQGESEPQEML